MMADFDVAKSLKYVAGVVASLVAIWGGYQLLPDALRFAMVADVANAIEDRIKPLEKDFTEWTEVAIREFCEEYKDDELELRAQQFQVDIQIQQFETVPEEYTQRKADIETERELIAKRRAYFEDQGYDC